MIAWLDRLGVASTLISPLFLLHGRGLAEAMFGIIAGGFLIRSALAGDWAWLQRVWLRIGLAWWAWLVLCTVLAGQGATLQALAVGRFLLLVAALEHWTLRDPAIRTWLMRLLRAATFYIAIQCAVQFAFGRNLFGMPRFTDGELTGPYKNPRAAAPLSRLLFPALLPLAQGPWSGLALLLGGTVVMVLIGQRMPVLLTFLGLFATALLLPGLRAPVLYACVAAGMLLAALPAVSPQAARRLESKFSEQMLNFPDSHYGLIAARAVAITRGNPIFGAGFDGFRLRCEDPRFFQGWHGDAGGGAAICVQHPHNFYLQAVVEGGVPGLLLFSALALAWLGGVWAQGDTLRVGLFVAALIQLWPLASTTAFTSMPLSGWFFLLLGLGLAEARAYMPGKRT